MPVGVPVTCEPDAPGDPEEAAGDAFPPHAARPATSESAIIRAMGRPHPINTVIPRWLTVLVSMLPGLGAVAAFLVLYLLNARIQIFNLSVRDSFLVIAVGGVLVGTILALLILCLALTRALRRALAASTSVAPFLASGK